MTVGAETFAERGGRPPCFNRRRAARVLKAIRRGLTFKQAAAYAGISYSTLNRWRRQGQAEDAPEEFRQFWKAFEQANGEAAFRLVGLIEDAARSGDWKAASWIMERRFANEWGKDANPPTDPLEPMIPI